MGVRVIICPNCGAKNYDGDHDNGYTPTDNKFVTNDKIFGEWHTLFGCDSCGHVWLGY